MMVVGKAIPPRLILEILEMQVAIFGLTMSLEARWDEIDLERGNLNVIKALKGPEMVANSGSVAYDDLL
ncbi:hypothetical protein M5689_017983 [Euphorbia peplus]|nr:hypothetical protein M5689_017983 [Euphorbia peplus]